jgi:hypothetical protein
MKPPNEIHRLPRSLQTRKFWKASEYKSFLLFYSPVILKDILPHRYFAQWLLLVKVTHIMLQLRISHEDLQLANMCLLKFVNMVTTLYRNQYVSYNVHLMIHLARSVAHWGPLWNSSAFIFEDLYGKLLSFYHGTQSVADQMFTRFLERRKLLLFNKYSEKESIATSVFQRLSST